ncbi:MAG: isocitrate/isopropylmalate dehydrogenase family protein [Synergistaceae bacterium]|nr:isocitrate/isopropylmalate dehydrogenase family protein [Synergistaceae bacterium]
MKKYKVAVIAGDGIGPEVIGEARKVLDRVGGKFGFLFDWREFPCGARHYLATGEIMPEDMIEEMSKCDVMLLGAIGDPKVRPGILERGILLELRFRFDQYVNLRPALSLPRVSTPVPLGGKRIDSVVVRENTEDLYMGIGSVTENGKLDMPVNVERGSYKLVGNLSLKTDPAFPFAAQVAVNSRPGAERITRYACRLAKKRGEETVTIVSKSNAVSALYGFFEDTAKRVMAEEYPELSYAMVNVDALCYHLVRDPTAYGVLLCPNLFGDIISDLQAGLAGGLGTAAGGNIGDGLSMFEPVHGSAPDIAGTGRANPVAAILSGALLLQHLGETGASAAVENSVSYFLEHAGIEELPFEFGGKATFEDVGKSIISLF